MKITGIYKIISPTFRVYIGQSTNIKKRFGDYRCLDCVGQLKLYASFIKHGVENHTFEILEECSIEMLNERERYFQEKFDVLKTGLNCLFVKTDTLKKQYCETSIINRSNCKKKEKNPMFGLKGIKNPLYGIKKSESHKKTLSEKSGQAKMVICINTGIYFNSLKEACFAYNLNYGSMMNKMQGSRKNNTSLIYI